VAPSPVRAPPPPGRKPPSAARTYSPESDSSVLPSTAPRLPPPNRQPPLASANGNRPLARRKIPSPPPNAGVHTFPVTGFPSPRYFKNTSKIYKSGRQRGSNFDLSNL
jgi:WAS/WASL-interacting protein